MVKNFLSANAEKSGNFVVDLLKKNQLILCLASFVDTQNTEFFSHSYLKEIIEIILWQEPMSLLRGLINIAVS